MAMLIALHSIALTSVYAQEEVPSIENGQKAYDVAQFEKAILLLTSCLSSKDLNKDQRVKAYELMALSSIALSRLPDAKGYVKKILHDRSDYESLASEHPVAFVQLVDEEKAFRSKRRRRKWQIIFGCGAVIVAATAWILLKPPPQLIGPPELPELPQ